jgi:hypothetical protein
MRPTCTVPVRSNANKRCSIALMTPAFVKAKYRTDKCRLRYRGFVMERSRGSSGGSTVSNGGDAVMMTFKDTHALRGQNY